jgi:hypothetical protein
MMIQHSQVRQASFEVRRKAKLCRVHEDRFGRLWVETPEWFKDNRVVLFFDHGILCVSVETGELCKANEFGHHCCRHIYAADRRREINKKFRASLRRTLARKRLMRKAA